MTPQEQKLVEGLFERLRSLENAPRDEGAVNAINAGLDKAPNALYPLVQTVLVQDEALKRADARIRELEAELGVGEPQARPQGGFLDNMRDAFFGKEQRGSVPSVGGGSNPNASNPNASSANAWGPAYNQGGAPMQSQYGQQQYGQPQYGQPPQYAQQQGGGGSFLGTAAATVAGVVGGAMLMNSFKGMFGQQDGKPQSAFDQPSGGAPWGPGSSNSDLAREAGLDDIGRGGGARMAAYDEPATERTGLFSNASHEQGGTEYGDDTDYYDDDGGDFGGDSGGGDD